MRPTLPPFQFFLDQHRELVWRFLIAAVGRDAADDCFQETFIAALGAYPRLRRDSNLRAWVLTIANRKAIDHHRRVARAPIATDGIETLERAEQAPASVDDGVWEAVRKLPRNQRVAVLLRFRGDLAHREIAAALGCSEQAARRSLHEGLTKLREVIRS